MSLAGETISDGAAPRCDDCGRMPKLDVYLSGAGYYIGTYCACGPYTRESGYYRTRELAEVDLDSGTYGRWSAASEAGRRAPAAAIRSRHVLASAREADRLDARRDRSRNTAMGA